MTKLEALAKDCIENHTHKLVDKPTKQDIYLREESIFIQGYRQSEKRISELEAQIEKMKKYIKACWVEENLNDYSSYITNTSNEFRDLVKELNNEVRNGR